MKLARLISTSTLSLVLGLAVLYCLQAPLYAQEQQEQKKDEAKPQQQQEPRPEASQDQPKAERPGEAKPGEQSEDRPVRDDEKAAKQDNEKNSKQSDNAMKQGQMSEKTKSAGNRIPEDKFRSHFGRQHTFKVHVANGGGGQPHFEYGGYTFALVDAWPADWAYTDDCYIDYIDGQYFLIDLLHPGVRIAVIVL